MPIYDVKCSQCGYEGTRSIKLNELIVWDREAICSDCGQGSASYRRIIKSAAACIGGRAALSDQRKSSERAVRQKKFITSGAKDDMRHKEFKRRNPDQMAASIESVRKGEFEGF